MQFIPIHKTFATMMPPFVRLTTTSFNATIDSADVDIIWRLLDVAAGDIAAPITLGPAEDVVLVAVVLPTTEVWSGTLSFDLREADLELTAIP